MPLPWPDKDPDDILDYGYAVEGFDDDDALTESIATVTQGGVTIVAHTVVTTSPPVTKTRLRGGTDGETSMVMIRTTMASGQQVDQTLSFRIASR